MPGEVSDGQRLREAFQGQSQAAARLWAGDGTGPQQLGLSAVAVRGDDHVSGDAGGGIAAVIGANRLHA